MNSSPQISNAKLSKDVSNLDANVFFLSGNDLSTDWHYGTMKVGDQNQSLNGITPIKMYSQTNAKTDGLTTNAIAVKVYEFNTEVEANLYYSSIVKEIADNRGYTEISYNADNCFLIDKSNYMVSQDVANCSVGRYVLTLSYIMEYEQVSDSEFKSILTRILNKIYS